MRVSRCLFEFVFKKGICGRKKEVEPSEYSYDECFKQHRVVTEHLQMRKGSPVSVAIHCRIFAGRGVGKGAEE